MTKQFITTMLIALTIISCSKTNNDSITLEFTDKDVSCSEQTIAIGVASSGDWIVTSETPVSWCSATKETSTTAIIRISENNDYDSRLAIFAFKCGNATAKLTITQRQLDALNVSTTKFKVEKDGCEISIPITTNLNYNIEIEGDASSWLTVKELKSKSLESYNVIVEISENKGDERRIGVLNIIGEDVKKSITITQYGVKCILYYTTADDEVITSYNSTAFGSEIESNVYENGIGKITFSRQATSIGENAFLGCSNLTSIEMPSSVITLGSNAFWGCSNLTPIEIPSSVISIGDGAFSFCRSLTSIEIPNSVTSIGNGAFSACTSLESFYGKYASSDNRCLIIDDVLSSFASAGLTEYTIPTFVTSIGGGAFSGCSNLTSIGIPSSVTSIGGSAFSGCNNLASIGIPSSVTTIGDGAFYGCSKLTSVEIPSSVTSIGSWVFYGCTSIKSFHGKFASEDNRCLINNGELLAVAISGLTSYNIPSSITSIGACAFALCSTLTSVEIPSSVTSIGLYAFLDCPSLASVYCKPTTPPTLDEYVFSGAHPDLKIFVPKSSVADYQSAASWSDYSSIIEGYDR